MTYIPFPNNVPNTNPYSPTVPLQPVYNPVQNYFTLDPNLIAAINRLAAALEKYNERSK